jgi:hypothetical protein
MQKIAIDLSESDLLKLCCDLADGLACTLPSEEIQGKEDDFGELVAAWRNYSPRFVALSVVDGMDETEAEGLCAEHNARAEILAHLSARLPA